MRLLAIGMVIAGLLLAGCAVQSVVTSQPATRANLEQSILDNVAEV